MSLPDILQNLMQADLVALAGPVLRTGAILVIIGMGIAMTGFLGYVFWTSLRISIRHPRFAARAMFKPLLCALGTVASIGFFSYYLGATNWSHSLGWPYVLEALRASAVIAALFLVAGFLLIPGAYEASRQKLVAEIEKSRD